MTTSADGDVRRTGSHRTPVWTGLLTAHAWLLLVAALAVVVSAASVLGAETRFVPDTRYYAGFALHLTGHSQDEAQQMVAAYTERLGYVTPPTETLFGWGLVGPRLVYPLLSVPFVAGWGIEGLGVVPVVAFIAGIVLIAAVAARRASRTAVLVGVVLLLSSQRHVLYGTYMLTESLSMLLVAGVAALLPWAGQRMGWRRLLAVAVLMTVLAFTRQSTLIPAGAVALAWCGAALTARSWRTPWTSVAAVTVSTAVGWQLLQMVLFPGFSQVTQWQQATGTDSVRGALLATPELAWSIITKDVTRTASSDRPLLLLLLLMVLAALTQVRRVEGQLLIGALVAVALYNVTNGTPVEFRYGAPAWVFVIVAVAVMLDRFTGALADSRRTGLSGTPTPARPSS